MAQDRTGQGDGKSELMCSECGVNMGHKADDRPEGPGGWRRGPVVHCGGSTISFGSRWKRQEHHGHKKYYCRLCGGDLGCDYCAQRPSELFCLRCKQFGLAEGQLEHGPVMPEIGARRRTVQIAAKLAEQMELT